MSGDGHCPECGVGLWDPNHEPWHQLLTWNRQVKADAEATRGKDFDEELAHRAYLRRRAEELRGVGVEPEVEDEGRLF